MPTIVLRTGTTFTVPTGCTSATVECIGSGGFSGGAYAKTNSVSLTPGNTVFIRISSSGQDPTWFNKTANTAPTAGQTDRGAKASGGAFSQGEGIYNIGGGAAVDSVGDVRYDGGGARIQFFYGCPDIVVNYGYGGAAGPNGVGGNGLLSGTTYGGGGGANGGGGGTSTQGGNNRLGAGGGANFGGNGSNGGGGGPNGAIGAGVGSYDPVYTNTSDGLTYGPSSGAGASASYNFNGGAASVIRGAGGGAYGGTQGMIVVTYTIASASTGNMFLMF